MLIDTIDRLEDLERLEADWESVRERDPHATIFGSWAWLRGWIEATDDRWLVLVARPDRGESPVAFLPLGIRPRNGTFQLAGESELYLAGAPMSDQNGMLCLPAALDRVLPALVPAVGQVMRRTRAPGFENREVADPRWEAFLGHFARDGYLVGRSEPTPCPRIPLPESWEEYIGDSKKRKALLRRAEREGFMVTHVREETLERYTDLFLNLHQARLGPKPPEYLAMMRSLVRRTHRGGSLYLVVLWNGDEPMAVNVGFEDRTRAVFHAYNGGWDEWYRKFAPRRVLELYSIRYAIEEGFRTYDLGRGAEGYKFGFGAVEHYNANWTVRRRTAYASARELVKRIPELLPFNGGAATKNPAPTGGDRPTD